MATNAELSDHVNAVIDSLQALMRAGDVRKDYIRLDQYPGGVRLTVDISVVTGEDGSGLEAPLGAHNDYIFVGDFWVNLIDRGRFTMPKRFRKVLQEGYGERPDLFVLFYESKHEIILAPARAYAGIALDNLKRELGLDELTKMSTSDMNNTGRVNLGDDISAKIPDHKLHILGHGDPYITLKYDQPSS